MSKSLNDNLRISAGKPIDGKYLNLSNAPYTGTTQVLSQIALPERHVGLTVSVNGNEYWFKTGVTNNSLIAKIPTVSNGLIQKGSNYTLGGSLTGNTAIDGNYDLTLGLNTPMSRIYLLGGTSNFSIFGSLDINSTRAKLQYGTTGGTIDITNSGINMSTYSPNGTTQKFSLTTTLVNTAYYNNLFLTPSTSYIETAVATSDNASTFTSLTLRTRTQTNNSPSVGFGTKLEFQPQLNNATRVYATGAGISYVLNNASVASANGSLKFYTHSSGSAAERLIINDNGALYSANYSATFTARSLVDAGFVTGITSALNIVNGIKVTATYTATTLSEFIGVSANTASIVYLPITPKNYQKITVKDIKGNGLTTNVTVNGNGKLIDGSSTALINTNYGSMSLVYNTVGWSVIGFA
jgi:hypothetical protein